MLSSLTAKQESALDWINGLLNPDHRQVYEELVSPLENECFGFCVLGVRLLTWGVSYDDQGFFLLSSDLDPPCDYLPFARGAGVYDLINAPDEVAQTEILCGFKAVDLNDRLRLTLPQIAVYIFSEYFPAHGLITQEIESQTQDLLNLYSIGKDYSTTYSDQMASLRVNLDRQIPVLKNKLSSLMENRSTVN